MVNDPSFFHCDMGMVNPYRMRNFSGLAFLLGGKKGSVCVGKDCIHI